jgi:hypothetical protein
MHCKNLLLTLGQVDEQDRARRAGLGETSRTGRDEQDRQDDDLDLDLVAPLSWRQTSQVPGLYRLTILNISR